MADEDLKPKEQAQGPTMLVATKMLKPPRAVLGTQFLPRTIPWATVIVVGVCAFIGFAVSVSVFEVTFKSAMYGAAVGGAIGFVVPQLSPLKGESIFKWLGLKVKEATATRVSIDGRLAKMHIGTFPLKRTALGRMRVRPAGLEVKAYSYDERGYPEFASTEKSAHSELERQKKLRGTKKRQLKASSTLRGHQQKSRRSFDESQSLLRSKGMPKPPRQKKSSVSPGVSLSSASLKKQQKKRKRRH